MPGAGFKREARKMANVSHKLVNEQVTLSGPSLEWSAWRRNLVYDCEKSIGGIKLYSFRYGMKINVLELRKQELLDHPSCPITSKRIYTAPTLMNEWSKKWLQMHMLVRISSLKDCQGWLARVLPAGVDTVSVSVYSIPGFFTLGGLDGRNTSNLHSPHDTLTGRPTSRPKRNRPHQSWSTSHVLGP